MPTDSYTFRVTISGADAVRQARQIRQQVEAEFRQVTLLDLGNLPEAQRQIELLRLTAGGVGKAMTRGFQDATRRLIADITTRAMTQAEEAERRITAVKRSELQRQETDQETEAQVEVELFKQVGTVKAEEQKRVTAITREEAKARAYAQNQEARAAAAATIEEERRLTAGLKEEERRRTLEHQDEIRKRQQAERELRQSRMQPTQAELARYGGGTLGMLSWSVQEAQMAQMGIRMLTYDVQHLGRTLTIAGAALTGPPILAMRRFSEYTRDTDRAARAMGLARDESVDLRHELIEQSQALALASPEEMASGLYLWATGIGATARNYEELQAVIEQTIPIQYLSYMQQLELGQATESTAGMMAEFRLEVDQTERVVEVLDATADRTFAAVGDLGEAFRYVGPVAHQLGISLEETAASMGLLADANIRGSMAGRAMRQLLARLTKTTEEEDEALNKLLRCNAELGESWRSLAFPGGKFIGLARWVDLLAAATANLTEEERGSLLATISTANELPALTTLVTRQIEAREHGINIIRAEEKILTGVIDDEVRAYADWEESVTGNIMGLESAHDSFQRKIKETTESESYQLDQMKRKWDAAMMALGEETMRLALPALEQLVGIIGDLTDFITENPWVVQAVLAAGGVLTAAGLLATTAGQMLRLISVIRTVGMMIEGWKAAQAVQTAAAATQTVAAGTQTAAADTQMAAAQVQATSAGNLGTSILRLVGVVAALAGGFEVGLGITNLVRGAQGKEALGQGEALGEIWDYIKRSGAMVAGTGGALTALLLGEDPAEAFEIATYEAGRLFGLIRDETEQITEESKDTGDELRDWNVELEKARRNTSGLGSDLMQLPTGAGLGLAAFTEAELQAIDELEDYLQRRNDLIEKQNDDLAEMETDFHEKEADHYRKYLEDRGELEEDLRKVREEPLWQTTKEAIESQKRQAKAIEEYNKRVEEAIEEHQRKLRNLREDHDDKMEGLEASRDARGIIAEQRRYRRAVRDAEEQKDELLESQKDRLDETLESEQEKIATMREERKADLEEKLQELDENYQKEARQRQLDFDKRYQEKQVQNQKELTQLDEAHAQKLARIMGWEETVRQALRQSYVGREGDLHQHLARMERMYLESYNMISQLSPAAMTPEEYRGWHEQIRGHQAGGYAEAGLYRLGEAGREFVLSASTTRAMERAIGHLSQARMMAMAGGNYRLDIHVTADEHFSPNFETIVRQEIVQLAGQVTRSQPGAHRQH